MKRAIIFATTLALGLGGVTAANATGGGHTPVTLCHATGSTTNPYVTITVDDDSVKYKGHLAHEDDLIPAPGGVCPSGVPTPTPSPTPPVPTVPPVPTEPPTPTETPTPAPTPPGTHTPPAKTPPTAGVLPSVTKPPVAPPVASPVAKNVLHEAHTDGYELARSTDGGLWALALGSLIAGLGLLAYLIVSTHRRNRDMRQD